MLSTVPTHRENSLFHLKRGKKIDFQIYFVDKGKQTMYNTITKYLDFFIAFSIYISQRIVKSLRSIVISIFHRRKSEEEAEMWLYFIFLTNEAVIEKGKTIFQKFSLL